MTPSTSRKTLNHNASGSKNKAIPQSNKPVHTPVNKLATNKPQTNPLKQNKPMTSKQTAPQKQVFVKSTPSKQPQTNHKTQSISSAAMKPVSRSVPSIVAKKTLTKPLNQTIQTTNKGHMTTGQHKKKFFIKPKQSAQQHPSLATHSSINTIVSPQAVIVSQPPKKASGVIAVKRIVDVSGFLMRRIGSPQNILFLGLLLCSSSIIGYIMSSLVKFQLARGDISTPQPSLGMMSLSDLSLFAGSENSQNTSGVMSTGANEATGTDTELTANAIKSVIAPNRDQKVEALVQGYYQALGDKTADITQRIMPGLNNRGTYQQYFNPTRVAKFKSLLSEAGLQVSGISITSKKNGTPTQLLYTLKYTWSSNSQTYTEQRRVDLRETSNGLRISKLFCESKGCSRQPFYRMR